MQLKHAVPAVAVAIALASAGCGSSAATSTPTVSVTPQCAQIESDWALVASDAQANDFASLANDLPSFTDDLAAIGLSGDGQQLYDAVHGSDATAGAQAIYAVAADVPSKCPTFTTN